MNSPPLRYVVLRHEGVPDPHFDLMFESSRGSALLTWRSPIWPLEAGTILTELRPHRSTYLEHEGPVSGDRGHVLRIAAGTYSLLDAGPDWFHGKLDELTIRLARKASDSWECERVSAGA